MRLRAKVDANQAEIVAAFRKLGCSVLDLSRVGHGCPDLLVAGKVLSKAGLPTNVLVEVKGRGGKLTPDQITFWHDWRGVIWLVQSTADVVDALRGTR